MAFGHKIRTRGARAAEEAAAATSAVVDHTLRSAAAALHRAASMLRDASAGLPVVRQRDESPRVAVASEAVEPHLPVKPLATPAAPSAEQLRAQHFERLAGIVGSAVAHSERAQALHDRAALRVDSALYELMQLRREIGPFVRTGSHTAPRVPEVRAGLAGSRPRAA